MSFLKLRVTISILIDDEEKITIRLALSSLAKIFDPLGWLTRITVTDKLFIQHLWKQQIEWDLPLEEGVCVEWKNFTRNLQALKTLKILRWYNITPTSGVQLHGFAGASERAYAAIVYLTVYSKITIVAAKSKVNPIKNANTLPKLELSAAHLLAKLLQKIRKSVTSAVKVYAWSDSMITLAWINNSKNKDKFIKNRVVDILERIPESKWGYVKSKENSADLGSRGVSAETLINNHLWWNGPEWLVTDEMEWKKIDTNSTVSAATRIAAVEDSVYERLMKISSFKKQQRVMAYVLRFIKVLRRNKPGSEHLREDAEMTIIKLHQELEWPAKMRRLRISGEVDHQSKLALLQPKLDESGVMRVGGRLQYLSLPYNQKHPIIVEVSRKYHTKDTL
ncbi:uncharacterized protein LOC142231084 [Haematobia irritans]|uniref:uncharacterized protein LOC142231084 n=1 Tax=Haematobia irritans TaxID=7368 RepID=UPI003F4FD727